MNCSCEINDPHGAITFVSIRNTYFHKKISEKGIIFSEKSTVVHVYSFHAIINNLINMDCYESETYSI